MAFAIVFCAVMMMKSVSTPSSRLRASTSRPERSGILMSTSATSKLRSRSAARASEPLPTATTVWPFCAQARSRTQRIESSSSATRIVPTGGGGPGSAVDIDLARGQRHAEAGTPGLPGLVEDGAAVLADDAVADCEAEPRAGLLGGEEGGEEMRLVGLGHPGPAVLHGDDDEVRASRAAPEVEARVEAGRESELSAAAEGLQGVLHQVQEDLRQLRAVAPHGGQARIERRE